MVYRSPLFLFSNLKSDFRGTTSSSQLLEVFLSYILVTNKPEKTTSLPFSLDLYNHHLNGIVYTAQLSREHSFACALPSGPTAGTQIIQWETLLTQAISSNNGPPLEILMNLGCSLSLADALAIEPQEYEGEYGQTIDHSKDGEGDIVTVLFAKW